MLRNFTEHALDLRMSAPVLGIDRLRFVCVCVCVCVCVYLPGLYPTSRRVSVNDSIACIVSQAHMHACAKHALCARRTHAQNTSICITIHTR